MAQRSIFEMDADELKEWVQSSRPPERCVILPEETKGLVEKIATLSSGSMREPDPEAIRMLFGDFDLSALMDDFKKQQYASFEAIGKGGFGAVYKAKDKRTNSWVAIKKIPSEHQKLTQHEIDLMKKCNSPFVLRLLDQYQDDDANCTCLVLEYCSGGSIEHLAGKCSQKQWKEILKDSARGLDYMHSQGIVHRDIKPQNILFDGKRYKVADLGLSKDTNYSSAKTKQIGTLYFMAPEILRDGDDAYSAEVDIWALGISAYYLATAEYPYSGASLFALVQEIVNKRPKRLAAKKYASKWRDLVNDRMLAKDPKDRCSAVVIMNTL